LSQKLESQQLHEDQSLTDKEAAVEDHVESCTAPLRQDNQRLREKAKVLGLKQRLGVYQSLLKQKGSKPELEMSANNAKCQRTEETQNKTNEELGSKFDAVPEEGDVEIVERMRQAEELEGWGLSWFGKAFSEVF
jgi:hypothetical protein